GKHQGGACGTVGRFSCGDKDACADNGTDPQRGERNGSQDSPQPMLPGHLIEKYLQRFLREQLVHAHGATPVLFALHNQRHRSILPAASAKIRKPTILSASQRACAIVSPRATPSSTSNPRPICPATSSPMAT